MACELASDMDSATLSAIVMHDQNISEPRADMHGFFDHARADVVERRSVLPAGLLTVQQMDPRTGEIAPLIGGLSSAIDVIPLGNRCRDDGFLSLEFNLTFPVPGVGRLQ